MVDDREKKSRNTPWRLPSHLYTYWESDSHHTSGSGRVAGLTMRGSTVLSLYYVLLNYNLELT